MRRKAKIESDFENIRSSYEVQFKKSSFCRSGECVQVGQAKDGSILVRSSAVGSDCAQEFTLEEWAAFVKGVKHGEFDFAH